MSHPRVICGTCGRDNPANLVFCQDCGARLGPRIAPPTPAIGPSSFVADRHDEAQPLDSFPRPDESRVDPPEPPVDDIDALLANERVSEIPRESRSRPSAPNFDFAPRENRADASEEPTRNRCMRCGNTNAPHIRYCLSCGNKLRSSQNAPPTEAAPLSQSPQLMATAAANPPIQKAPISISPKAADQPISPVPVVEIGSAATSTSTIRICNRCRGVCESTAQFCKFCGASLGDTALTSQPYSDPVPPRPQPPRAEPPAISLPPATPSRAPGAGAIRGRLVVIAKDGGEGASYPFADRLDVGRTEGDVIVPDDPYISPRHARLSWKGDAGNDGRSGKLLLRDLGSTNGVYLRLAPERANGGGKDASSSGQSVALKLQDQDLILLGQQVIRFEVVRDAEEGLGPASQHGTLVFGTPAAPRYARLCLRTVEGVTRDVYYLGKRETILGRESGDIIFAEDPFLSRRHASIVVHQGTKGDGKRTFALSDFGSSNGTFLQIRGEVPLESGSEFRVGQQLFRVELNA
jgi:pSer/pThr/pTyr-binding forkhead associated (FHA) protein/predicted amidophosphoribosyltransferase